MNELDVSLIEDLFYYDGKDIRWKTSRTSRVVVGRVAGSIKKNGYRQIKINKKQYQAHRLVWVLHHKEWPSSFVDHINGNKLDNRIENLRVVSKSQNGMNRAKQQNNTSGYVGVYFDKRGKRWRAQIKIQSKTKSLGSYKTKEEAAEVYDLAATLLFGEYKWQPDVNILQSKQQ